MQNFYKYNNSNNLKNNLSINYNQLQNISNNLNRNISCPNKNKLTLKNIKHNTCESLNDVEHFLCNFSTFIKYIKLYNLLK